MMSFKISIKAVYLIRQNNFWSDKISLFFIPLYLVLYILFRKWKNILSEFYDEVFSQKQP